jgi:Polysaccharide deacetylase
LRCSLDAGAGQGIPLNPVVVAARGKGVGNLARRTRAIASRYGISPRRMEKRLADLQAIAETFQFRPTLPVTVATARRNEAVIKEFSARGVEFAVHGYYHVDHRQLPAEQQQQQIGRAREELRALGMRVTGFRAPYLRANDATMEALRDNGFTYDGSQAFHWPVDESIQTDAYDRGLQFCSSLSAVHHPVLPWSENGLLRTPVALPDDEAIFDRLHLSPEASQQLWVSILDATAERGELFTLALHPERIDAWRSPIVAVLEAAAKRSPPVWLAPLDEIATWWRERSRSSVELLELGSGMLRVSIRGPEGVSLLGRGLDLPGEPWLDGYVRTDDTDVVLRATTRPFLAVHPASAPSLITFLREQGYIVELTDSLHEHAYFLRRDRFLREDQRGLLSELEGGGFPLLRLARWPYGSRSALSITGDVDALTIWDYASRFVGR